MDFGDAQEAMQRQHATNAGDQAEDTLAAAVGEVVAALVKAARAHQLYQPNSPVYHNFVESFRGGLRGVLGTLGELTLRVRKGSFEWEEHEYSSGEGRDAVAYLFYRDGVRTLTFRRGFEEEVEPFLETVRRARMADREGDDVVTLLWEAAFEHLTYGYQDVLPDEPALVPEEEVQTVSMGWSVSDLELVQEDAAGAPPPPQDEVSRPAFINPEEFEETLYFLSEPELRILEEEARLEWSRDLRSDVLDALFDRLEEPVYPERQADILDILAQVIPITLGRGDLASVARILGELEALLSRGDVLAPGHRERADALFEELSDPDLIAQLVRSLEEGAIAPPEEELSLFLGQLRGPALPALIRAAEETRNHALRELLSAAVARIAGERTEQVLRLLDSPDPRLAVGAARVAGRLRIEEAVPRIRSFLERPDAVVRLAAVESLASYQSALAVDGLKQVLEDPERDVRVAAARALGALRYGPAAAKLEERIRDRGVRAIDLTEKMALFDAYAAVAGERAVPILAELLNARSLLGRRPASELRACAARALGSVDAEEARSALRRAEGDPDPVVRSAVSRALRAERSAE